MMNRFEVLKEVYSAQQNYLALSSKDIKPVDFDYLISQIFSPGPFFYYILDSPTLTFDFCSVSMPQLLGRQFDEESLNTLLERIHPDDFDFLLKCENFVAVFLKQKVSPDKIIKYKISYCVRLKVTDGTYHLFLLQNIAMQTTEDGALLKVLGIHSDISHITQTNNYKLSLTGLDGEPSYLGLDVDEGIEVKPTVNPFSNRELEVIKLLGEGLTAKNIADQLHVSEETVKSHKKNILQKANFKNSTALVAFCVRQGLI